jgi:hypothetical protein
MQAQALRGCRVHGLDATVCAPLPTVMAMDAAPLATLNIRLADAYRIEHHGLHLLEAVSANPALPAHVRDRADIHRVETGAQLAAVDKALQQLGPSLSERLRHLAVELPTRKPGVSDWMRLEQREIAAYSDLLPYVRYAAIDGFPRDCACALDLQRSVLHWLQSLESPEVPRVMPGTGGLRLAF